MAPMGCRVYLARPSIVPCEGRKEGRMNPIKIKLERYDTEIRNRNEAERRLIDLCL
jgi:hypothetical protein